MKYNRRYLTTNSFNEDKQNIQKLNIVISQDVEASKVYLHRLSPIVSPSESSSCDICFYDKTNDKLIIVKGDMWNIESFPSSKYTPIGIVVVPGTHNVYGDGSCGVMSLKAMSCNTPSEGGTYDGYIYWGESGTNISGLPDLELVPTGNTSNGIATGGLSQGRLPSDKFSNKQCAHDTDAYYKPYNSIPYIPSPYLTDGSRNFGYYQTTSPAPSSSMNALADFNGIENTKKIITQRGIKDYDSWIPDRLNGADYPAASCCDMFHTEGTQQGDWYLPACGELGYIMPPFNKINDAIGKMRTAYGSSVGIELANTGVRYWSSTESSSSDVFKVYPGSGDVNADDKGHAYGVRGWLRVRDSE